jgi:hypothetical protein
MENSRAGGILSEATHSHTDGGFMPKIRATAVTPPNSLITDRVSMRHLRHI